ncbi:MAG: hypothetical protein ACKVS6_10265 [Planctomycetota bacterium]
MSQFRRRQKLPKRALQLKLTFTFVGLSALGLLLQFLLFMSSLSAAAEELPHDSEILIEATGGMLIRVFLVTSLIVLPITLLLGILSTFKIAGPIYKFEKFLKAVINGEQREACWLRKGDELNEMCDLLNRATEPLRNIPNETVKNLDVPAALPSESRNEPAARPNV